MIVGTSGLDDAGGDSGGGEIVAIGSMDLEGELLGDLLEVGSVDGHLGL